MVNERKVLAAVVRVIEFVEVIIKPDTVKFCIGGLPAVFKLAPDYPFEQKLSVAARDIRVRVAEQSSAPKIRWSSSYDS